VRTDDFRELMCRFPTGVAIVTSINEQGRPSGMTCSSLASVCLSPPTLLVCLRTSSATFAAVRTRLAFAVNVLDTGGRHAADLFSSPEPDRFAKITWRLSPNGLPWLVEHTAATADCTVVRTEPVGDHTVVFAEPRQAHVWDGQPLLYGMRRFLMPASDILQPAR
jgi:flavin reductase (NADH)